jgi:hypothetical protein
MIDQQELPGFVEQQVPELTEKLKNGSYRNAYDIVRQLFNYTASQIVKHNIAAAKKCLSVAEQLYQAGNTTIRNAIENVYVYSFSSEFFYDEARRHDLMAIVPGSLYEIYKRQVINSHI